MLTTPNTTDDSYRVSVAELRQLIERFAAAIGRDVARTDAESKIWPLLGFRLRDCLSERELSH